MRIRLASLIAVTLAVSGCTVPTGRPMTSMPIANPYDHLTDEQIAINDANELMYIDFYHPEKMIGTVENCYHTPSYSTDRKRGCLMLDYAVAKDWRRRHQQFNFTVPAYFSDEAQLARFTKYGPEANFNDPDSMYHVLHEMYFVMEHRAIESQAGTGSLCVPGSMPTIPPKNCLAYPFKIRLYHMGT